MPFWWVFFLKFPLLGMLRELIIGISFAKSFFLLNVLWMLPFSNRINGIYYCHLCSINVLVDNCVEHSNLMRFLKRKASSCFFMPVCSLLTVLLFWHASQHTCYDTDFLSTIFAKTYTKSTSPTYSATFTSKCWLEGSCGERLNFTATFTRVHNPCGLSKVFANKEIKAGEKAFYRLSWKFGMRIMNVFFSSFTHNLPRFPLILQECFNY